VSGVWLKDLVKVLRKAGIEAEGMTYTRGRYAGRSWKQVGWSGLGYRELRGIMWHHDASPVGLRRVRWIGVCIRNWLRVRRSGWT
jgi:hypothetical protein